MLTKQTLDELEVFYKKMRKKGIPKNHIYFLGEPHVAANSQREENQKSDEQDLRSKESKAGVLRDD